MRFLLLLALLGVAPACSTESKAADSYDFSCTSLGGDTSGDQRCENTEAVCYKTAQGGISCLKK